MAARDLLHALHDISPYEGHDTAAHPADLQGWGSTHPIFAAVIRVLRPAIIVEVGTWKGASAIHMGRLTRAAGIASKIICVDTWLGSPEHFMLQGVNLRESLRLRQGYPQLYFTFLTNVILSNLQDIIIPLPATSENGAHILAARGIRPDLVYIDAAHEYGPVRSDLETYWGLLSDNGVLIGDDFDRGWPGVVRAARDFAQEHQLQLVEPREISIQQTTDKGPEEPHRMIGPSPASSNGDNVGLAADGSACGTGLLNANAAPIVHFFVKTALTFLGRTVVGRVAVPATL